MTATIAHRVLLDEETLVDRAHKVAMIATALEMDTANWPGEGAKADMARLAAARRIGYQRWRHRAEREARQEARR